MARLWVRVAQHFQANETQYLVMRPFYGAGKLRLRGESMSPDPAPAPSFYRHGHRHFSLHPPFLFHLICPALAAKFQEYREQTHDAD
jgi:hypothetical protein